MRHEVRPFVLAATGIAGPALLVQDLCDKCIAITTDQNGGASAFSVKVQGKISGPTGYGINDTWFDVSADTTAAALIPLDRAVAATDLGGYDLPFTHLRIFCTTIGAKAPVVVLAGRNTRTDH